MNKEELIDEITMIIMEEKENSLSEESWQHLENVEQRICKMIDNIMEA